MTAIDWNAYRRDYDRLTDEEHRDLYERVWKRHPIQRSATVDLVKRFLCEHDEPVTEIGSWDGWLRRETRDARPWLMVEICQGAMREAMKDLGVSTMMPNSFRWWRANPLVRRGALIACHVIEHLSDADFREMARAVFPGFSAIYLEAPLPQQGPCNWDNYEGSHVMRMGWDGVRAVMSELGFVEQWAERDSVTWRKA